MPTKKKKYNARFPPARIKKIMQKDEEVGKVASTVPVMLSRLLELFTESLILKTNELTVSVNARTLTTSHLKQVILSERKFDFLKDLVAHIPDVQANDEDGGDSNSDQGTRPRPRGRPRKKRDGELVFPKRRGRRPKAVVPLQEDTLEEDNSDDSETEDADSNENEDPETTSDETNCDRPTEGVASHARKRKQIDDSAAAATTSSFYDPDSQPRVSVNDKTPTMGVGHQGSSGDLLTANSMGSARETQSNVAAMSWGSATNVEVPSIEQTASEPCLPLNLKTAGNSLAAGTKGTKPMASVTQDLETYLMQQQQELHRAVGLNFGKIPYHADAGGGAGSLHAPPGFGLLVPPPAHQPISQVLRQPLTSACVMQPPFVRSNLLPPTASEFVSRINLPAMLDNTSPGVLSSPVLHTSSQAVHRMPVVPASFPGPGAVLARSTSMPHGTGVVSKPSSSSLVTSPDDDYDS